MDDRRYPIRLAPVRASILEEIAVNAALALGPDAVAARELVESGWVAPDVLAAMTLVLLAGQPRRAGGEDAPPKRGGVAGSVWVREHFTVHRPVRVGEPLEVGGEIQRAYSRDGRRYSVTTSETRDRSGVLLASNCTTGLVRYRRDPDLADASEGVDEDAIRRPAPDPSASGENPAVESLRALAPADEVRGVPRPVTLEQMRVRDGGQSRNPIHTDPEAARAAGLALPIAGGSHVFGFLQEALMNELGREALLHGACFDLRFTSQVRAGSEVESRARVTAASDHGLELDLEVRCEDRVAVTGSLAIPLPAP